MRIRGTGRGELNGREGMREGVAGERKNDTFC
jgi:hypothetical protein